ncbi:5'-methylthioadenosine/S-adenosylhomocysteine nucleosidase [Streptomyces omiyaensis]|uniref:5'-methylthioadenosine/S-adenosylhomocysteine nucleosidase n=1 Tax=Streptomyces omiyaensis TaxID=68247 RepID=A0ABW7BWK5_9ACTN
MVDALPLAVVLTALPVEYQAVRVLVTDTEDISHPSGTRVEVGLLSGTRWRVALVETGVGAGVTAVLTERLVQWLSPRAVFFVGVAGGLKDDIALGDVVVATKVYAIHGGKYVQGGFQVRPQAWSASHRLEQAARAALRGSPGVHFKPIASGDVVMADELSEVAALLRSHYNDAAALEMEGAGLVEAAHLTGGLDALVVRGISDKADRNKSLVDAAGSHERAADRAAGALAEIVALLESAPGSTVQPEQRPSAPAQLFPILEGWSLSDDHYEALGAVAKHAGHASGGRLEQAAVARVVTEALSHLQEERRQEVLRSLIERRLLSMSPSGRVEVSPHGIQALVRKRKAQ